VDAPRPVPAPCETKEPANSNGYAYSEKRLRHVRPKGNVFRGPGSFQVDDMKRKDILRKLEERLARGEINEKTYLETKARYESEPEEPEESEEAASPNVDLGSAIGGAVAQATADATRMANDAVRAVGDAMRAVDFSGGTTKLSDETSRIVGSGGGSGNPVKTHEFKSRG